MTKSAVITGRWECGLLLSLDRRVERVHHGAGGRAAPRVVLWLRNLHGGLHGDLARAVIEDLVLAVLLILLAHEFQRVAEGGNRGLQRCFDVATLELEAVDLALDPVSYTHLRAHETRHDLV